LELANARDRIRAKYFLSTNNFNSVMNFKIVSCGILTTTLFCVSPTLAEKKNPAITSGNGALAEFKRCSVPAATLPKNCDDTRKQIVRINSVVKLYQKGNKAVLADLITGAIDSDTYLGETYGAFFAGVAVKSPSEFLQAVSLKKKNEDRETLYRITALSFPDGQVSKVNKILQKMAAQKTDKLSAFAQEFLTEIKNSR
jgi:hypothetical protein